MTRATTHRRWQPRLAIAALTLGLAVPAVAALAQTAPELAVRGSSFGEDGNSSILVSVSGLEPDAALDTDAFTVTENGTAVEGLSAERLTGNDEGGIVTVLALDISTSMAGEPLDSIKGAAIETVETLTAEDIAVGLLSFESRTEVLSTPTTDADLLTSLIEPLEATGGTALHDAVIVGVEQLAAFDGARSLIVLADGEDTVSNASLDEAIATAQEAEVPVTVIALVTELFDPDALRPLAEETGGGFVTTDDTGQVDQLFADVAEDITSQYTLSYASDLVDAGELDIDVAVSTDAGADQVSFVVANPRDAGAVGALTPPPPATTFDGGPFATSGAFVAALVILFVLVGAFLALLFIPRGDRQASRTLERGVTLLQRGGNASADTGLTASSIGRSAVDLVSRAPKPEGYDDRLQQRIDQAGWQFRAGEFTTVRIAVTLLSLGLFWSLSGAWWIGLIGAVIALTLPGVLLNIARDRRRNRFMAQLPDTLQLLAGTLKAGYGVLQAIDTVVKEVDDPMSSEFQRALTEARLGLPLEDSLGAMADRIGSDDFRWVVVAMNIQRQVGGNLAELLETVAATLRGREELRGEIQVLSAEGRISAWVLIALPLVIIGALLVLNPAYLAPLLSTLGGIIALVFAGLLMIVGTLIIRKLVRIEV